jgi:hypothetical protein
MVNWDWRKKESYGFGALAGEDSLNKELSSAFGQASSGNRFENAVSNMVSGIINTGLGPWLNRVFMRYPPVVFHQRMASGFDFVVDLKTNHAGEYERYISAARGLVRRKVLRLDPQNLFNNVTAIMRRRGYDLNSQESNKIWMNIQQIVQMIYS